VGCVGGGGVEGVLVWVGGSGGGGGGGGGVCVVRIVVCCKADNAEDRR